MPQNEIKLQYMVYTYPQTGGMYFWLERLPLSVSIKTGLVLSHKKSTKKANAAKWTVKTSSAQTDNFWWVALKSFEQTTQSYKFKFRYQIGIFHSLLSVRRILMKILESAISTYNESSFGSCTDVSQASLKSMRNFSAPSCWLTPTFFSGCFKKW